jgi:Flp pilus assembly protein TadD
MAVGWVKYALSLTPEDWSLWETLGALYFKLGRKAEAQAALEKALLIAQQEGVEHEAYADTEALLEQVKAMPD